MSFNRQCKHCHLTKFVTLIFFYNFVRFHIMYNNNSIGQNLWCIGDRVLQLSWWKWYLFKSTICLELVLHFIWKTLSSGIHSIIFVIRMLSSYWKQIYNTNNIWTYIIMIWNKGMWIQKFSRKLLFEIHKDLC